ncbi:MJ0042 family finger-like protein [Desulfovibrio sp. X2]|uniref:DUF3426 domain-containing protein n=1 Tax=Desulfovibrio sp. X2 TaxID=941449 RepID=UPI000358D8B4|nr:DUF3426 domain-containing protein [Desulfovibrio sp. X2]EPR37568.1 MJ0042 family finger-like protein [Desulfovibrio sp. X2]
MIVQCPKCNAKYNLPDEKIPAEGAKVRCSQCAQVFHVHAPGDEDLDDLLNAGDEEASASGRSGDDAFSGLTGGDDDLSFDFGDAGKKPAKAKKKAGAGGGRKRVVILAVVLLLLAGAGAGLWYSGLLARFTGGKTAATAEQGEAVSKVKHIVLENVRQYYVNNEKAGQLFVIEGKAVNQFETPKEFVKIEVTLFDAKGKALTSRQLLCGNILSYFQLQVLSRAEIEAGLGNEVGVLNNNSNLETGAGTPFMAVFFDPPKDVAEYGVKVIDVQDQGKN